MGRSRTVLAAGSAIAVIALIVAVALRPGGSSASPQAEIAPPATATVERRTLLDQTDLDGTLGYANPASVVGQRPGIVTALPAEGQTVERGQSLYEVDGKPVILLIGARPMWRPVDETVSDGPDVRQLEENLVALGYGGGFKVDDRFTVDTAVAVKKWQRARGVEETGRIDAGDVSFQPSALRVTSQVGKVGSRAEGELLKVTSTARAVTVDLDAGRQQLVKVGDAVEVELPDGSMIAGTVASVGAVATSSDNGSDAPGSGESDPTVPVSVTLASTPQGLDSAPVTVRVTRRKAENVLTVPVNALLAEPDGGYAVEVVDGSRRQRVAVETGLFAKGRVEVSGDGLREGQEVVVPR